MLVLLCVGVVIFVAAVRTEFFGLKLFGNEEGAHSVTQSEPSGNGSDSTDHTKERSALEVRYAAVATNKPISVQSGSLGTEHGTTNKYAAVNLAERTGESSSALNREHGHVVSLPRPDTDARSDNVDNTAAAAPAYGHAISGRVLNQASEPVANIEIIATVRRFFDSHQDDATNVTAAARRKGVLRTASDQDGAYVFRALADGEYEIRTKNFDRYAPARINVRAGVDSADLRVVEQQPLRIHGVVTSSAGELLAGVRVVPSLRSARASKSDAAGRYALSIALTPNVQTVPVSFFHDDYRRQTLRIDASLNDNGDIEHDVALEPVRNVAMVEGNVRSSSGLAVAGVTVRLYSPGYKRGYKAVTDYSGHFEFAAVETAHDYLLAVRPTGLYQDYTKKELHVRADRYLQIVLDPADEGILSGQMVDAHGAPIPGFTLAMRGERTGPRRVFVTGDRTGWFLVPRAPIDGVVFETYSSPKFRITGVRPSPEGNPARVQLVLDWGTNAIQGQVVDSGGTPVAASEVTLTWAHTGSGARSVSTRRAATDGHGRFRFTRLGPGPHTISARAPGYEGVRLKPVAGIQHELVVRLEKNSI